MIHVSTHAIIRYQERIANVPEDAVREALTSPAIQRAVEFGARYVRLASGHRIVLEGNSVITVLPPDSYRRQVRRLRLSRYTRQMTKRVET